jgi:hypothetical protein
MKKVRRIFFRTLGTWVALSQLLASSRFQTPAAQAATAPPSAAQTQSTPTTDQAADSGWPREFTSGDKQITIYQPQVESWKNNQIQERAAVSVQTSASAEPTFGVIWMTARTEVDKSTRLVALEDLKITKVNFPSKPGTQSEYVAIFQKEGPSVLRPVSLERLQASLAVTKAEGRTEAETPQLRHTPPKIIYSSSPAALVLIDGEPALRESGTENIQRVVNTRYLILFDTVHGKAYLWLGDRWLESSSAEGPFAPPKDVMPSVLTSLNQAKEAAASQKLVDLLDDPDSGVMQALKKGTVPTLYVSTTPAELIQTQGPPQMEPVAQTPILYVKNTANDIFLDTKDQDYYVLISGRWYRAPSLTGEGSQWMYVPQKSLPREFAKIPESHPRGDVLASVKGTPQAQEAAISNQIPQTATIDRNQASADIQYDGGPQFQPIQGTPLQYAVNSAVPVIEVDPNTYYSVQNGIWFASTGPSGPWVAATQVPSVIYTIPPSSPLYYVTYVYVYGHTPRYVYTGYLPGYLGSYVTTDGMVVYGTGYYYTPWIGSVWYGPPVTYGFGITWGFGFGWGFSYGFYGGYFGGPLCRPWWGPWGYGAAHGWGWARPGYLGPVARGPGYHAININRTNIYRTWNTNVVRNSVGRGTTEGRPATFNNQARNNGFSGAGRPGGNAGRNNIYADHQGNVYRQTGQGWQRYGGNGWNNVKPPSSVANTNRNTGGGGENYRSAPSSGYSAQSRGYSASTSQAPTRELGQESMARQTGEARATAPSTSSQHSYSYGGEERGGGYSGGGGSMGGGGHAASGHGGGGGGHGR